MARIAYLDCFSGVSGDMILGAMLDAGLDPAALRAELAKLPLSGYSLEVRKVRRAGLAATQAFVSVSAEQPARTIADILALIDASSLPDADKERGAAVFRRLAEAEAAVHGEPANQVHLHEVGAVDALVDVMGAVAGLRLLDIGALYASPLPLSSGEAASHHGAIPLPAPATLELLARARAPVRPAANAEELVTPTGAAIVTTLATFGQPEMTLEQVGYGAGSRDPAGRPNVLRLWLGRAEQPVGTQTAVLLETNIDDMTGEALAYAVERLLAAGALDAWLTPVQMKKGRPGVIISAICREEQEAALAHVLLRETSTLGVRVRRLHRWEAAREVIEFVSSLGPAAVKVKRLPGEEPLVVPEYEACARLARERGMQLTEVYRILQAEGAARLADRGG